MKSFSSSISRIPLPLLLSTNLRGLQALCARFHVNCAERNMFELIFGYFLTCFQWNKKLPDNEAFENRLMKNCCDFHQLQVGFYAAIFITFQCTKERNFPPISVYNSLLLQHTQCRKSGAFFGFPVYRVKTSLSFVLKMKSFIGISHKRLLVLFDWLRRMSLTIVCKHVWKFSLSASARNNVIEHGSSPECKSFSTLNLKAWNLLRFLTELCVANSDTNSSK